MSEVLRVKGEEDLLIDEETLSLLVTHYSLLVTHNP